MRRSRIWPLMLSCASLLACGVKVHSLPAELGGATGGGGGAVNDGIGGTGGGAGRESPDIDAATNRGGAGGSMNHPRDAGGGAGGQGGGAERDAGATLPADGPVPSGEGVVIGGTMVPKEKVVVFIHIGHSDMCGRATGPANLKPFFYDTDPHLWMYGKGHSWKPAKEPTGCFEAGATRAGPGMAILRTALAHAPDGYFVSIGYGHSGAENGYCPNFRRGGLFYNVFMDVAKELKGKVTFGGIYTMFGITEYHLGNAGLATLGDCLAGIGKDVREDLDEPNIPLMVGDWNQGGQGIYAPTGVYGKIAVPQIHMVPDKIMRAAVIPTDGLPMEDDRHLNMAGHKMWAERGFKLMSDMGWTGWATMP
jgi:hypothetical protein